MCMTGVYEERYELALDRIREIPGEHFGVPALESYFAAMAEFILLIDENRAFLEKEDGSSGASLEQLKERNLALYRDIMPENYGSGYADPAYAVSQLGEELGAELSFLYVELRSMIGFCYEGKLEEMVIRLELFSEVYTAVVYEWQESQKLPRREDIRKILYWFVSDYADVAAERRIREQLCPEDCFAARIICGSDLTDLRYLYAYGEYVSDSVLEMAEFLNSLPEETIAAMADTYTEGYRIGFEVTNKDLSKKQTVALHYQIGFERMMRRAIENFEKMGLKPVIFRNAASALDNPVLSPHGFYGGMLNRQYAYDHKDDKALFLDRNYVNRRLEATRTAYEEYREQARGYAGPAVVETFGEQPFTPVAKKEALKLSEEQNRLWVEYRTRSGEIQREYILEEERSFTIIAFPVPEIGPIFRELFQETVRINTLDYMAYRKVQQNIIDVLDTADHCEIKGGNGNRTDLRVNLHKLEDPEKETIFENCVADVNIPVGEVFTSPVLKGTDGVLHVSRVYLNGLEFHDLAITFKDGMIDGYSCDNFASEEENRAFISENILFRHPTLPMGEFAIGTNTTAYVAARRLGVEDKLPILIAEKMGPHFAVGDTCYSHVEDIVVHNPDGKEIVARDNEVTLLRKEKPSEAYFNCHTDITIPYDELEELAAVRADGSRIPIIRKGRFVLPGCEVLNEAFRE
ncbi:MAG: aminopeptidase [Eubacterium sp.]|nr:aminopeptidase [Eubacterium sp.]MCM1304389.1 aminopeptidase [Butyrivibrio sp.]MCM1343819.1 aminopeptidase [Muribaculaceae bacterium]MCM1410989.1 aminopeptidase [Lachnospiraceae bacterium]